MFSALFTICLSSRLVLWQLAEELREKEKKERQVQEELEGLKDSLYAEEKAITELTEEREKLRKLLEEKEFALVVNLFFSLHVSY